jgi:hypothetical protein
MNWLKWILAYLFDCVHPHTTWPHRDRVGLAYVCCLGCGRELPYSLQRNIDQFTFNRRQLDGMKKTCQKHCFSTLNHNLAYCYNDAPVIKWM